MTPMRCCAGCGRIVARGSRCLLCGGDRRSMTTTQRGYGWSHQQRRAALLPLAVGTACPLCGKVMTGYEALDLHHPTPLVVGATSIGIEIVHASCNRRGRA